MDPIFGFPIVLPPPGARERLRALHGQLRAAILDGRLKPGLRLPATRELAEALQVSRNTVVAAYDLLLSEGYVIARRGAGNYVADLLARHGSGRALTEHADKRQRLAPYWREFSARSPAQQIFSRCDFRLGAPDKQQFPFDVWRRLSAHALRDLSKATYIDASAEGRPALRDAIARHVSFARAVACHADDVIVTNGAQQAFDLLARVLVTAGQTTLAMEDPGYPPLRAAFTAAGAHVVAVPVDDEGLIVEQLPASTQIIYVTPSHQFPLGVPLSPRRRTALLAFAQTHNATIIEDDYDGEFRYGGRPLDALQTLDRHGSVCYVGTFSKCLFPTLRLGYVVAPPWLHPALTEAKRHGGGHCDVLAQETLAAFIAEGHLVRHVRKMHKIYAARREVLLQALVRYGDNRVRVLPSDAGLHLAVLLPGAVDIDGLIARAAGEGIQLESLAGYAIGALQWHGLAFGFGVVDVGRIDEAVGRLMSWVRG